MSKRNNIITNVIWRFLERSGAQFVGFVVSIILARLLAPTLYGQIALINVFISIMQVFVDSGLGNALIQKKEVDELDYSSVFVFNIISCTLVYIILFIVSPFISKFLGDSSLTWAIRISGFTIVISGVKNIQQAYISRNLMFKKFFFSTLVGTLAAAIIGVYLAFSGFGIWALVVQGIVNNFIDTFVLWITVGWFPKISFSWKRFKSLFSFGWKLLASSLLDTVYNKVKSILIGKVYTPADLAFFERGDSFPNLIIYNINSSIDSVLFPAMSGVQNEKEKVKEMTRRSITLSTYILAPIMVGLVVCARPLVLVLLSNKWLSSVFYIQIFCFVYLLYPIHTANLNAIKAVGRSDIFLKLEIIKKIVGIILICSTMFVDVKAVAVGALLESIICVFINSWPNKVFLSYGYKEQLSDIAPYFLMSFSMGAIIYLITFLSLDNIVVLCLQIFSGMFLYWLGSKIFHFNEYNYIKNIIKGNINAVINKTR